MTLGILLVAAAFGLAKPDTMVVDTAVSVVKWKGTKFFGLGKHEGIVRLVDGYVAARRSDRTWGGRFVVDMRSIEVTDIPPDDPIPRNRLRRHLMDEDFFAVELFPTAVFVIRTAATGEEDPFLWHLTGDLTMRGVTRSITLDVRHHQGSARFTSTFKVDRHQWGVSFRGSRLTNDLVDDDIHFTVDFVLRPKMGTP